MVTKGFTFTAVGYGVTWEKGIDAEARAFWGPMLALAASRL